MNKKEFKTLHEQERLFFAMTPAVIWQVLFFFLPVLFLVLISFVKSWDFVCWDGSFTLQNYRALFNVIHLRVLTRSFLLAISNAFICLLVAYPIAYFIAIKGKRWKNILLFFLIVPFFTNFLVLVYSWFFVFERNGIVNNVLSFLGAGHSFYLLYNMATVLFVMVYCYVPFMALPIYSSLEKMDCSLIDASADLGASFFQTFIKIIVPQSFSGIKTGFFLVFIPSFGEYVIPTLLGKGEPLLTGTLISYYFLQARNSSLGAAFTCISCLFLVLIIITAYVFFRCTLIGRRIENGKN